MRLSAQQLRRVRVSAQLLGGARSVLSAPDVVAAVVGIQAQDPNGAALSIRARSADLRVADVRAATETGELVLMWSLRGTRHLHRRSDVRWLLGLLGPAFNRPGRRAAQLGIDGETGANAVRVVRDALAAEGPLTRDDIKGRLAAHRVDPSGQAPVHVLQRAALEGVLCILPGPKGEERYVLLDDWVPPAIALEPEHAAAELARRYLRAYRPAGPADFAVWSGLGAGLVKAAWASIAGELTEVDGAGWVMTADLDTVGAAAAAAPVRMLGGFDTLLLGYADRTLFVPAGQVRKINAGGGLIKPTVLADGGVVATWRYPRYRGHRVEVTPFRELSRHEEAAVAAETAAIGRFLNMKTTLEIVAV